MTLMFIGRSNEDPVAAAEFFYRQILPGVELDLADPPDDDLLLVWRPCANEHEHRGWRLAAIQSLARRAAPLRVNGVVSARNGEPLAAVSRFLANAPGVTGQLLAVDAS